MSGRIVLTALVSAPFARLAWTLARRKTGPPRRTLGPGQQVVGYVEGAAVGPLHEGRWWWRQILVTRDGDERLHYRPAEAVEVAA